jgi:hypothetical protein
MVQWCEWGLQFNEFRDAYDSRVGLCVRKTYTRVRSTGSTVVNYGRLFIGLGAQKSCLVVSSYHLFDEISYDLGGSLNLHHIGGYRYCSFLPTC